jgi:lipoprotein-anchoring transpeptidase ErfK/SrfK
MADYSRRLFLRTGSIGIASVVSGCGSIFEGGLFDTPASRSGATVSRPNYAEVYGKYSGEQFPVTAFDYKTVDPAYLRQVVAYKGPEPAGTIVVSPSEHFLYLVEPDRKATRFGVGVGREGFGWSGTAQINMRRAWPDWVPPKEMVERDPDVKAQLVKTSRGDGVPGGPKSPLGARAMYLYGEAGDTGYRLHGTTEPETIGTSVSSGCVRLVNQDVIYLYGRAPEGAKVIVLSV